MGRCGSVRGGKMWECERWEDVCEKWEDVGVWEMRRCGSVINKGV